MPKLKFKRGDINANQNYLKSWDDYQIDFLNNLSRKDKDEPALLLPISVDIDEGIIKRHRIKTPELSSLWAKAGKLIEDDSNGAFESYMNYFKAIDRSQSSAPPTPLDFDVNSRVYMLFYLPRKNWTFTDRIQFSVDNISKGRIKEAFEVVGTFDDGHAVLVHNKNWQHKGKKTFKAKYNLHVSIHQIEDDMDMVTDIIIDPGSRNNRPD